MTESTQRKAKASPVPKRAKAKGSWSEAMKKALKEKRPGGSGPDQPKPRDSGTFKVRKDSI